MSAERLKEDHLLVQAFRCGSPDAVELLFNRFNGSVYGLAFSLLKNSADAQEATREVFTTVIRKVAGFRGTSGMREWVLRVCVHACLDRLRKNGNDAATGSIDEYLPEFTEEGGHSAAVNDWSDEKQHDVTDGELEEAVKTFAYGLPENYRLVFALREVGGLSFDETAKILGMTVPAVKCRLHRARLYLRERLTRYMTQGNRHRGKHRRSPACIHLTFPDLPVRMRSDFERSPG